MYIVRVKVDKEVDKPRWLEVPVEFADKIHKGTTLLCYIKGIKTAGVATTNVMYGDGIEEMLGQKREHYVNFKVLGIFKDIFLEDIKINFDFKSHLPSIAKINQRLQEFYLHHKFNTIVEINRNGYLVDGYTAYLVAKMFDEQTIYAATTLSE